MSKAKRVTRTRPAIDAETLEAMEEFGYDVEMLDHAVTEFRRLVDDLKKLVEAQIYLAAEQKK